MSHLKKLQENIKIVKNSEMNMMLSPIAHTTINKTMVEMRDNLIKQVRSAALENKNLKISVKTDFKEMKEPLHLWIPLQN